MFRMFLGATKYGKIVRVSISVYRNPGESPPLFGVPGKEGRCKKKGSFYELPSLLTPKNEIEKAGERFPLFFSLGKKPLSYL